MKTFLTAGVLALALRCESQASLTLAQWTFETSQPATSGFFVAEQGINSGISLASGSHAGNSTYSSPAGARSHESFSSDTWAVGDYYEFKTSTLGFGGISVSFKATSSDYGPQQFQLAYSVNGTLFTAFTTYSVLDNGSPYTAWSPSMSATNAARYIQSFDLSAIPALNNQSKIYLQLIDNSTTSAKGGSVAGGGTSRVDDFTISANAMVGVVPEPSTFIAGALLGLPFGLSWLRRRLNRHQPKD